MSEYIFSRRTQFRRHGLGFIFAAACFAILFPNAATAQGRRDYLSSDEAGLVSDEQVLDKRTEIFIKAAERRFAVLNGVTLTMPKPKPRDDGEPPQGWGDPPKGTRTQLITDIGGILDGAIDNIDDVSVRDPKNPQLGSALRKLAAAARKFATQLTPMREQAKDADELAAVDRALENIQMIVDAEPNAPAPVLPDKKKKKP